MHSSYVNGKDNDLFDIVNNSDLRRKGCLGRHLIIKG